MTRWVCSELLQPLRLTTNIYVWFDVPVICTAVSYEKYQVLSIPSILSVHIKLFENNYLVLQYFTQDNY